MIDKQELLRLIEAYGEAKSDHGWYLHGHYTDEVLAYDAKDQADKLLVQIKHKLTGE